MNKILLYVMAVLFVLAGANHFWHPAGYLKIIPPFLPYHEAINYVTGALEILFGALLLFKATRNIAAWGLILLLILVFPANIQMAYDYKQQGHPLLWAAYLRLPLQLLLIWWVLIYTNWYRSHDSPPKAV
ncbi:MAG TPA: MauE/DoxX family redox-associated membrane protein [Flavisolibacter sp.]|jgi:uncharacterized membrane protein|nr:MauE/DoxX family redox-associated membrane protein [Flavisolibacter sp.]